jgi:hypothetical protein
MMYWESFENMNTDTELRLCAIIREDDDVILQIR